jgi:hypothetical protein
VHEVVGVGHDREPRVRSSPNVSAESARARTVESLVSTRIGTLYVAGSVGFPRSPVTCDHLVPLVEVRVMHPTSGLSEHASRPAPHAAVCSGFEVGESGHNG